MKSLDTVRRFLYPDFRVSLPRDINHMKGILVLFCEVLVNRISIRGRAGPAPLHVRLRRAVPVCTVCQN